MYDDIRQIVPHREPMIMLDWYTKIDEENAVAEKHFSKDDYSVHDGYVADSMLVECVAQTIAAHFGYYYFTSGDSDVKPGLLATIDSFNFFDRVKEASDISIQITRLNVIGPFKIFQGKITCQDKLVAEGEIKVVQV